MNFILQIDTALTTARIGLSSGGNLLLEELNKEMKDHGAFVQPAITKILVKAGITAGEISAIAVSHGPGSYTGLRVGMASAKGLSYALNKPLITVGSLEILTKGVLEAYPPNAGAIYCPMIDARRMEVFTALYDGQMNQLHPPSAAILGPETYANWLLKNEVWFFGDGAAKFSSLLDHPRASFKAEGNNALAMSKLAFEKYTRAEFADNAYVEPLYVKEFFSPILPS